MTDEVINKRRREFVGASALILSGAMLGVPAMTNATAVAADAVDPGKKRIAFVHAKVNKKGTGVYNVDSLQAVGRQATASLAFLARYAPVANWSPDRWRTNVQANTITLIGRNRIFRNTGALAPQRITDALAAACGNPTYDREVWIVAGNTVNKAQVASRILAGTMDNRLRQFLMHWDGLRTACARAGARLLLFCH